MCIIFFFLQENMFWVLTKSYFNPYPAVHDNPYPCKQCRSRSDGFWRSHLIRIYTICHSVYEFEKKNKKQHDLILLADSQK